MHCAPSEFRLVDETHVEFVCTSGGFYLRIAIFLEERYLAVYSDSSNYRRYGSINDELGCINIKSCSKYHACACIRRIISSIPHIRRYWKGSSSCSARRSRYKVVASRNLHKDVRGLPSIVYCSRFPRQSCHYYERYLPHRRTLVNIISMSHTISVPLR
jgi:hypothetical protein